MIIIKNKTAIAKMETAGQKLAAMMESVAELIKPGVNSLVIDQWMNDQLKHHGLVSMMRGYKGYRHVTCISVNDEVVHGVPRATRVFNSGDLVKIDICASYNGYAADMARCYFVGTPAPEIKRLAAVAWSALNKGIEQARPGNHLGDISAAIQQEVEAAGFGVVRIFAGHGIGKKMHEDPEILNYGKPGKGPILRQGMTFALEPMITAGSYEVYVEKDGWTAKTTDQSWAAHVEDTVVVTEGDPRILTREAKKSL